MRNPAGLACVADQLWPAWQSAEGQLFVSGAGRPVCPGTGRLAAIQPGSLTSACHSGLPRTAGTDKADCPAWHATLLSSAGQTRQRQTTLHFTPMAEPGGETQSPLPAVGKLSERLLGMWSLVFRTKSCSQTFRRNGRRRARLWLSSEGTLSRGTEQNVYNKKTINTTYHMVWRMT